MRYKSFSNCRVSLKGPSEKGQRRDLHIGLASVLFLKKSGPLDSGLANMVDSFRFRLPSGNVLAVGGA